MDHIFALLEAYPALFTACIFVFSLMVGSFLNVVIYRLPVMMERGWKSECRELLEQAGEQENERFNLIVPRSRCPHCGHLIGALENIPLLSYLLQKGRCKHCEGSIPARYPVIELTTAILSAVVAFKFGFGAEALFGILLTWALIALTGIDIDHQLLPDSITMPFLWLGILLSFWNVYVDLPTSVTGAMAGYLSLWSIYWLFKLATGKEGMGYGDFKLLALLGAWFGWQFLPTIILLSSIVGAVVGISLILFRRHERSVPIPFGPYLAAAGWIAMLWGEQLNRSYLQFMSIP